MEKLYIQGSHISYKTYLHYMLYQSARQRGGPINSKQKKSIFAVPDSIEGRVRVFLHTKTILSLLIGWYRYM